MRHPFRLAADVVLEDSEVKLSSPELNLGIDAMWKKSSICDHFSLWLLQTHTYITCSVTRRWTEDTGILQCFLPPMAWAQRKMEFQDTGGIHFTLCSHRDKTAFDLLYRQSVFYLLIKKERNMLKYVLIKCLIGFCTFLLWGFVVFSSLRISWRTDGLFLYSLCGCARNPAVNRWSAPAYIPFTAVWCKWVLFVLHLSLNTYLLFIISSF